MSGIWYDPEPEPGWMKREADLLGPHIAHTVVVTVVWWVPHISLLWS